jgi:hypothetical protein
MKNFLLIILIATGLIACKNKSDSSEQRNIQLLPDATSYSNNVLSDTNSMVKAEVVPQKTGEKSNTKTIVRTIVIERPAAPNGNTRVATKRENDAAPVTIAEPASTTPGENNPVQGKDNSASTETSGTVTSSNGEKVQKKTGMNKATQGAIIGGVTGAVAGAVISKKKGLGAVVGGIAGAAGGYIIGKKMDKKDNKFMIE